MGAHSSSANFGNSTGTAIFAIAILGAGAPWPAATCATAFFMVLIAVNFAVFGRERPPEVYREIIQGRPLESYLETNELEVESYE